MADTKKLDEVLKNDTQTAQTSQQPSYTQQLQQMVSAGYTPSETVTSANNYLQQVIASKPGSYQSAYTDQLQSLYDQIINREKFSYDMNADALYNQYKQQYQQMGKTAMQDTMGQAAALTGGYGNSYASTAGNQAYQNYLQLLNDKVPEFAQMAFEQYQAEGDALNQKYAITQSADESAYGRWLDSYNMWNDERSFAQNAAELAYNRDYAQYGDRLNAYGTLSDIERADAASAKEYAYNTAMTMLENGLMPSADILASAGISQADAQALADKLGKSSSKSSSGSSTTTSDTGTTLLDKIIGKYNDFKAQKEAEKKTESIYDKLLSKFTK